MELNIEGKVAVVTASSKGLGRAVAEALAKEGVNLAICSRDKERIQEAAHNIRARYEVEVLADVCDVTDITSIESFKGKVIDHFNTCHILYANAGGPPPGKAEDFTGEDFKKAVDLNLMSTINLVYAFLPFMKDQEWGRILASASITVKQPLPTLALSNVSRAGVVAFIKTLSKEVAPFNVTANTLAPGYIMTERVIQLLENQAQNQGISYHDALEQLRNKIPGKTIGKPEDFGALCAFLASEHASYITGETFLIDGGMYSGVM
ncbi:MAG: SDR family oxidoreductase [Candidatus Aminicenantes bacterium]|nr:MAG: SDR family oxidoreductase [Candidatus Aminicenantes bacterium]